jgi:plasmid stability protein
MPILHVRNVPKLTYERLQQQAAGRQSSLSAEVVRLLDYALYDADAQQARRDVLETIHRRRQSARPVKGRPDSVALLRSDRSR